MSNEQFNITTKSWDIIASRVYSGVNANLILEASGTSNLILKTNGNIIVSADPTANVTFIKPPICSVYPPTIPSQLVNKQYMDSLNTSGAQGPGGQTGAQGAQGSGGAQGSVGAQGLQGTQGGGGSQGTQGAQGLVGAQGAQGGGGAVGAQGPGGSVGAQGAQGGGGSVGAQGPGGPAGGTGAQGPAGPAGGTGAQGPAGPAGGTGATGADLSISNGGNFSISPSPGAVEISLVDSVTYVGSSAYQMRTDYSSSENIIFSGSLAGPTWDGSNFFYFDGTNFIMSAYLKVPLNNPGSGGGELRGFVDGSDHLHYLPSSLRYKTNIEVLPDSDDILQVDPVFFNYKASDENPNPVKTIGFIAEEMEKNELGNYFVIRNNDGSCETIDYSTLVTLYASVLRTLKTRIANLTNSIENLKETQKNKFQFYEEKISALEKIVKPT
jgi:hypothetical protein